MVDTGGSIVAMATAAPAAPSKCPCNDLVERYRYFLADCYNCSTFSFFSGWVGINEYPA